MWSGARTGVGGSERSAWDGFWDPAAWIPGTDWMRVDQPEADEGTPTGWKQNRFVS